MYAVPPPGIPYWTWLHARGVLVAVIQAARAGQVTTAHPVPAQNYPPVARRVPHPRRRAQPAAAMPAGTSPSARARPPCMTLVTIDGAVAA